MDLEFCENRLPDWGLECWGVPNHMGPHQGGNFTTRRMGVWGTGFATHVVRMRDRDADL